MPIIINNQKTKCIWLVGGEIGLSSSAAALGGALDYTCIPQECMEDRGQPWRSNLRVKGKRFIVFSWIFLQLQEFLLSCVSLLPAFINPIKKAESFSFELPPFSFHLVNLLISYINLKTRATWKMWKSNNRGQSKITWWDGTIICVALSDDKQSPPAAESRSFSGLFLVNRNRYGFSTPGLEIPPVIQSARRRCDYLSTPWPCCTPSS